MFRRFTAILLALLVLVSSTGYSITAHLCHGKAVSYSLFGQPADCGLGEEASSGEHCEHPEPTNLTGDGCQTQQCCTNQQQYFKGIEPGVQLARQIAHHFVFVLPASIGIPEFNPVLFTAVRKPLPAGYRTPDRRRDLPVLFCIFRI